MSEKDLSSSKIAPHVLDFDDQPHKEEEAAEPIVVPVGMTLTELRRYLPTSAQLIMRLETVNPDDTQESVGVTIDGTLYSLFLNVDYVVGNNTSGSPWLYLNPVTATERVPDESNIPLDFDNALATPQAASLIKRIVTCPDLNLAKFIISFSEIGDYQHFSREFQQIWSVITKDLPRITQEILVELALQDIENGSRFHEIIQRMIYYGVEDVFIAARLQGTDTKDIDIEKNFRNLLTDFLSYVKGLINKNIPLLTSTMTDNSLGIVFDKYAWDPQYPDEGSLITTIFMPGRGWSIALPYSDCPAHAARAIDNFISGELNTQTFQKFTNSLHELVQRGLLKIEDNMIILTNKKDLRPHMAVFHGDNTMEEALETLQAMGDPLIGEVVFQYMLFKENQIVWKDEGSEPIPIEFDET